LPIGRFKPQPQNGSKPSRPNYVVNGDHNWDKYIEIAKYFVHKVRFEDRADFLHDLILEMAEVKAKYQAKGKPLTEAGLMRVASYEVTAYWDKHKSPTMVVDCGNCNKEQRRKCREEDLYSQCPKAKHIVSLNQQRDDGEGKITELWETIADDSAIDIDAWLDAKTWLLGCPRQLVEIAHKTLNGEALSKTDRQYLWRFRENGQKRLF